jgi:hypothetical protein
LQRPQRHGARALSKRAYKQETEGEKGDATRWR